jgi:hypothetical protein
MSLDPPHAPQPAAPPSLSPSSPNGAAPRDAFELKLVLSAEQAEAVESWARRRLAPDPHGRDGTYHTTSLYCDTAGWDVYHKSAGYRRSKYRVRRYGAGELVHVERKTRRGDRVRKRRDALPLEGLALLADSDPGPGESWGWFARQVRSRGLCPACRVAYDRTALVGATPEGPLRLTLDRNLAGVPAGEWELPPLDGGRPLLPGGAVLELKYPGFLPALFREVLALLPPGLGRVSKYRLCVRAWGLPGGAA